MGLKNPTKFPPTFPQEFLVKNQENFTHQRAPQGRRENESGLYAESSHCKEKSSAEEAELSAQEASNWAEESSELRSPWVETDHP